MPQLMPRINATADFFTYEDGREFRYAGEDLFGAAKRFHMLDGPEALVRPLLIERRGVADQAGYHGPIVMRVFRYSDPGNPFGMLPSQWDFANVDKMLDMFAEYNMYIDWTCGDSDHPIVGLPSAGDRQAWLNQFCASIHRFCFVETENEPFKNGMSPQQGVVPPPSQFYLRDSGAFGDIGNPGNPWPVHLNLDFVSYHGTRSDQPGPRWPKWVYDCNDSLATMRTYLGKPSVLKEPNKFAPGYYTDPVLSFLLGNTIAYGGVTFHSQKGLESNGYDDATRIAALYYYKGIVGGILT